MYYTGVSYSEKTKRKRVRIMLRASIQHPAVQAVRVHVLRALALELDWKIGVA